MTASLRTPIKKYINDLTLNLTIVITNLLCFSLPKLLQLSPEHSSKFEIKILKIGHHGSHSPNNAEFGNFTFWPRNVARIITHVHNICPTH